MPRKAAKIGKALEKKGMDPHDTHHHVYKKKIDGVTQIITRISHGRSGDEISNTIATRMANQCFLQLAEFWRLVDCPMSEKEWDAIIVARCVDGRNPFLL